MNAVAPDIARDVAISIRSVAASYGDTRVLERIDLDV